MRRVLCGLAIVGLGLVLWLPRHARELPAGGGTRAGAAHTVAAGRIAEAAFAQRIDAAPSADRRMKDRGVNDRESASSIRAMQALTRARADRAPAFETSRSPSSSAAAHPSRPASPAPPSASSERDDAMAPVARLYLAYFQRLPDMEGFEHYVEQRDDGRPLAAIADEFAGSREFAQRYGDVNDAQFLDLIGQNLFEGELDRTERAQWLAQLDAGNVTRGEVMLALSEGSLFRAASTRDVNLAIEGLLRARKPR